MDEPAGLDAGAPREIGVISRVPTWVFRTDHTCAGDPASVLSPHPNVFRLDHTCGPKNGAHLLTNSSEAGPRGRPTYNYQGYA